MGSRLFTFAVAGFKDRVRFWAWFLFGAGDWYMDTMQAGRNLAPRPYESAIFQVIDRG